MTSTTVRTRSHTRKPRTVVPADMYTEIARYNGHQGWDYQTAGHIGTAKVRITVHHDTSYASQIVSEGRSVVKCRRAVERRRDDVCGCGLGVRDDRRPDCRDGRGAPCAGHVDRAHRCDARRFCPFSLNGYCVSTRLTPAGLTCNNRHMTPTNTPTGPIMVIPCCAPKLDRAAPAADLYTSSTFKMALAAAMVEAESEGGRVLIMSALHGLVTPDTVLAPYDVKMGDDDAITVEALTASAIAHGIDWGCDVYGFLPRAYMSALYEALVVLDVYPADVYEACGGIGDQRHVCSNVAKLPIVPLVPELV